MKLRRKMCAEYYTDFKLMFLALYLKEEFYSTFIQPLFYIRIIISKQKPHQTAKKWLPDAVFDVVEITGLEET